MKAESVPTTGSNADVDANWNVHNNSYPDATRGQEYDKNAWMRAAAMQAAVAVGLVLTNTGPKPNAIKLVGIIGLLSCWHTWY